MQPSNKTQAPSQFIVLHHLSLRDTRQNQLSTSNLHTHVKHRLARHTPFSIPPGDCQRRADRGAWSCRFWSRESGPLDWTTRTRPLPAQVHTHTPFAVWEAGSRCAFCMPTLSATSSFLVDGVRPRSLAPRCPMLARSLSAGCHRYSCCLSDLTASRRLDALMH